MFNDGLSAMTIIQKAKVSKLTPKPLSSSETGIKTDDTDPASQKEDKKVDEKDVNTSVKEDATKPALVKVEEGEKWQTSLILIIDVGIKA